MRIDFAFLFFQAHESMASSRPPTFPMQQLRRAGEKKKRVEKRVEAVG
jgi:hypothetical protein